MEAVTLYKTEEGETLVEAVHPCVLNLLTFEPDNGGFSIGRQYDPYTPTDKKVVDEVSIFGIVGVLQLDFCKHLLVITERILVGKFEKHSIYKIGRVDSIKISPIVEKERITSEQLLYERLYLDCIKNMFASMFFSLDLDLTQPIQSTDESKIPLDTICSKLDNKFVWNHNLLAPLLKNENSRHFIVPVIYGYIDCCSYQFSKESEMLTMLVISRLSRHNAGMKSRRAGVDIQGNAAIEAETEQILIHTHKNTPNKSKIASFLQLRGSTPLIWNEIIGREEGLTERYDFVKLVSEESFSAFTSHFQNLQQAYNPCKIKILDLLQSDNSDEKYLKQHFTQAVQKFNAENFNNTLSYQSFSCSSYGYKEKLLNNISKVLPSIKCIKPYLIPFQDSLNVEVRASVDSQGYYLADINRHTHSIKQIKRQVELFRINSFVGVDRTNIIQLEFSISVMKRILKEFGIYKSEKSQKIIHDLARMMIESGNTLSQQYTGSDTFHARDLNSGIFNSLTNPLYKLYTTLTRKYALFFEEGIKQEEINFFLRANTTATEAKGILDFTEYIKNKEQRDLHHQQYTIVRMFIFLRNLLAPRKVGVCKFPVAMGWLVSFVVLSNYYKLKAAILMVKTKSFDDCHNFDEKTSYQTLQEKKEARQKRIKEFSKAEYNYSKGISKAIVV